MSTPVPLEELGARRADREDAREVAARVLGILDDNAFADLPPAQRPYRATAADVEVNRAAVLRTLGAPTRSRVVPVAVAAVAVLALCLGSWATYGLWTPSVGGSDDIPVVQVRALDAQPLGTEPDGRHVADAPAEDADELVAAPVPPSVVKEVAPAAPPVTPDQPTQPDDGVANAEIEPEVGYRAVSEDPPPEGPLRLTVRAVGQSVLRPRPVVVGDVVYFHVSQNIPITLCRATGGGPFRPLWSGFPDGHGNVPTTDVLDWEGHIRYGIEPGAGADCRNVLLVREIVVQ